MNNLHLLLRPQFTPEESRTSLISIHLQFTPRARCTHENFYSHLGSTWTPLGDYWTIVHCPRRVYSSGMTRTRADAPCQVEPWELCYWMHNQAVKCLKPHFELSARAKRDASDGITVPSIYGNFRHYFIRSLKGICSEKISLPFSVE